jgi:hypothetical protein
MRPFQRFITLEAFTGLLACVQDVSGDWQGTLKKRAFKKFGFSCKSRRTMAGSGGPRC